MNFETFESFASASLDDIYGKSMLENAIHKKADTFAHCWFENKGNGGYTIHQLPSQAQFSTINDMVIFDYNQDDYPDILVAGNLYNTEVETPRSDASIGLVLLNDGMKGFQTLGMQDTGLLIDKEVKNISPIKIGAKKTPVFVFGTNNEKLKVISFDKTKEYSNTKENSK